MTDAKFLFDQFAINGGIGEVDDYALSPLPDDRFECVELSSLPLNNPKARNVARSVVWYPSGQLQSVRALKFMILADSPDCAFYFLRVPKKMSFKLNGPEHSVLNLTAQPFGILLRMTGGAGPHFNGCRAIIGERSFCASAKAFLLNTDLIVKKGSLWSDDILVQGSNQHGIVDLHSRRLIDTDRNRIVLEPHAWIGRRAILCAGAHIGPGSIVGTGGVAAKRYPGACIVAGNPGRIIRRDRTWAHRLDRVEAYEVELIDRYVEAADSQSATPIKSIAQSLLLKAAAAGAAGAAAFEAISELTAAAI